jgi:hypothetical protein
MKVERVGGLATDLEKCAFQADLWFDRRISWGAVNRPGLMRLVRTENPNGCRKPTDRQPAPEEDRALATIQLGAL